MRMPIVKANVIRPNTMLKARSPELLVYLNCKNHCIKIFKANIHIKSFMIPYFIRVSHTLSNTNFKGRLVTSLEIITNTKIEISKKNKAKYIKLDALTAKLNCP